MFKERKLLLVGIVLLLAFVSFGFTACPAPPPAPPAPVESEPLNVRDGGACKVIYAPEYVSYSDEAVTVGMNGICEYIRLLDAPAGNVLYKVPVGETGWSNGMRTATFYLFDGLEALVAPGVYWIDGQGWGGTASDPVMGEIGY